MGQYIQISNENPRLQCRTLQTVGYDLPSRVIRRRHEFQPTRMSVERANSLSINNPERERLYDLAEGILVPITEEFQPNANLALTPLRSTYIKVHTAVNRLIGNLIENGLAFVIPKDIAMKHITDLHIAKAHWAPKTGKASGRAISDLTFVDGTSLNTESAKSHAKNFYGKINHPQIKELVQMILRFYKEAKLKYPKVTWSDIRLWKMDLKGAYTLLSFRPENVGLFGVEVTGEYVFL